MWWGAGTNFRIFYNLDASSSIQNAVHMNFREGVLSLQVFFILNIIFRSKVIRIKGWNVPFKTSFSWFSARSGRALRHLNFLTKIHVWGMGNALWLVREQLFSSNMVICFIICEKCEEFPFLKVTNVALPKWRLSECDKCNVSDFWRKVYVDCEKLLKKKVGLLQ